MEKTEEIPSDSPPIPKDFSLVSHEGNKESEEKREEDEEEEEPGKNWKLSSLEESYRSVDDLLLYVQAQKKEATRLYRAKEVADALEAYESSALAAKVLLFKHGASLDHAQRANLILTKLSLKRCAAACCVALKKWDTAINYARDGLELLRLLEVKGGKKRSRSKRKNSAIFEGDVRIFGSWRVETLRILAQALIHLEDYNGAKKMLVKAQKVIKKYTSEKPFVKSVYPLNPAVHVRIQQLGVLELNIQKMLRFIETKQGKAQTPPKEIEDSNDDTFSISSTGWSLPTLWLSDDEEEEGEDWGDVAYPLPIGVYDGQEHRLSTPKRSAIDTDKKDSHPISPSSTKTASTVASLESPGSSDDGNVKTFVVKQVDDKGVTSDELTMPPVMPHYDESTMREKVAVVEDDEVIAFSASDELSPVSSAELDEGEGTVLTGEMKDRAAKTPVVSPLAGSSSSASFDVSKQKENSFPKQASDKKKGSVAAMVSKLNSSQQKAVFPKQRSLKRNVPNWRKHGFTYVGTSSSATKGSL